MSNSNSRNSNLKLGSVQSRRILTDRPHQSKEYRYETFLRLIPQLEAIESRAPALEYYYIFVHRYRRDFWDTWGRSNTIHSLLEEFAEKTGIPLNDLFTTVYVYSHSSNAHKDVVDSLLEQGFSDIGAERLSVFAKGEEKAARFKLGLLESLQDPRRHEEMLRPRETAKAAIAHLRDPATAARIASARGNTPAAKRIIGNITRKEAQRNRAETARKTRNNIRKTVRNTVRLPKNITRNVLYSYMTPARPKPAAERMQNSLTANVPPLRIAKLFPNSN